MSRLTDATVTEQYCRNQLGNELGEEMINLKTRTRVLLVGCLTALTLMSASAAQAATFTVNTNADPGDGSCSTGTCTLHEAIDAANGAPGSTINFDSSVTGQIDLGGPLPRIYSSMAIVGPGASQLNVRRASATLFRIIYVAGAPNVSISGLTLSNGITEVSAIEAGGAGGGIYTDSNLTLDGVVVSGNSAVATTSSGTTGAAGGGIANAAPFGSEKTLTIRNSVVSGNSVTASASVGATGAEARGAGIYNAGTLVLDRSTVSVNAPLAATGVGALVANGGGIQNDGRGSDAVASITNSTIVDNKSGDLGGPSPGGGGGITNDGGTLTVTNSTVVGNQADDFGGGIENAGATSLNSVTILDNVANSDAGIFGDGGGTWNGAGTTTVKNTLYGYNDVSSGAGTNGKQCSGDPLLPHTSQGYNLRHTADPGCSGFNGPGDIVNGFSIGSLDPNGGPTETHALLAGSPPVNAGNPATPGSGGGACPATDQRGLYRGGSAGRCDIGAFELGATVSSPAPNTTLGSVKIRRAARKAKFSFSSTEVGSSFLCKIDKKAFSSCSSPKNYKRLKRGKHKFQVQARDAAGNLDGSPAVKKFKI